MLERGERGYLLAFIINSLLQSHPEIFDWPKEGDARRVDFFGNKLEPLWQEDKAVICHVWLRADGVRVSWV